MCPRLLMALVLLCGCAWGCGSRDGSQPVAAITAPAAVAANEPGAAAVRPADSRKLIFNGTLEIRSENYEASAHEVAVLIQRHEGFVAGQNESNLADSRRTGTWTLRVLPERFDALMAACARLGEVQRREVRVQDVTEEVVDLEARERTRKVEEERLLELLKTASSSLEDVLRVEKEVTRVREEIERIQGRSRVLQQQIGFATLTLTINQLGSTPPEQPIGLFAQVSASFRSSLRALTIFLQFLIVATAALLPWMVLIGPGLLLAWWLTSPRKPAAPIFTGDTQP